MKKAILLYGVSMGMLVASTMLVSCEKYDEVPPAQVQKGGSYKLPDPQPLTQEDRAEISALETEYNENAK